MKIKKMLMVAIVAIVAIAAPLFSTKALAAEDDKIDEYTPVDITVPFTKVWDGGEGERPESVTVNLYRFREGDLYQGAEPFATAKVSGEEGWKYNFDLKDSESDPLFYRDADGNYHPYSFATEESPIPGFSDIARKNPELVLKIEKAGEHDDIWIKPSDANGFEINTKDTPMSFIAMKSGETLYIWTPEKLSLSEQIVMFEAVAKHPDFPTEWKDTTFLTGYGHYDKGGFATSADKVEFDDFSVWSFWARGTYVRSTTDQLSASITSVVDLTDVTVTVKWDDADNKDGIRPEKLELTLNGVPEGVEPTVAKDGSTWTYTWTGLPKTDADGAEIAYTVAEESVPEGYKADPATVAAGGTITNTHEPAPEPKPTPVPEPVDVTVIVKWDDADNKDGIRPEKLELTLNGVPEGTPTPDVEIAKDGNTWTYTWKGLPKTDADGKDIAYTATEAKIPDGYKADPATVAAGGIITNVHEPKPAPKPETVDVTATVKWDDANNRDGLRPQDLALTLNGLPKGTEAPKPEVKKDGNTWTYTWKGLPKTDADGKEIAYTIAEEKVPSGYTADYASIKAGGTITNTHKSESVNITVTVKWDDADNKDGLRPKDLALTVNGLPKGTDAPKPEVKKDGGVWTYTWTGLPKFDGGKEIAYTVSEGTVPTGYEVAGAPAKVGGTITNTHKPGTVTVTVTVKWDDADNGDGLRPEDLALTLNGLPKGTDAPKPEVKKDGSTWTYTWTGLPKYADGKEIAYTVSEAKVPAGYEAASTSAKSGGTITNAHKPEKTVVNVAAKWVDADDKEGIRPASIKVTLLADGKPAEGVNPIDLNEATGWKGAWENLPKYTKDGKEIAYTVQTAEIEGYTTSTKKAGTNGFEVTSTITGTVPTPDDGGKDAGFPIVPVIAAGVVAGIAVIAGAAVYLAKSGREERN